jgi:CrcB protein
MEFAFPRKGENRAIGSALMTPAMQRRSFIMLKNTLIVGLGGFLGSIARFKLGGFILHRSEAWNSPLSTFLVNLIGCFVIGVLAALVEHHDLFSSATRLFLFAGVLGGFTTFSAFAYEGVFLLRRGMINIASLYAALSVVVGLAAVWVGLNLVDLIWRTHH